MTHATLRDDSARQRYELVDEGQVVAFIEYRQDGDTVTLVHTEVDSAQGGKGYGSALARQALDELRTRRKKVIAMCEFIAGYVRKHPEYADLVKPAD